MTLERINVEGSRRVFEAAAAAGVPKLVHASSVGAYSCGPKNRKVNEDWPTEGTPTSFYSRHKVAVESVYLEGDSYLGIGAAGYFLRLLVEEPERSRDHGSVHVVLERSFVNGRQRDPRHASDSRARPGAK